MNNLNFLTYNLPINIIYSSIYVFCSRRLKLIDASCSEGGVKDEEDISTEEKIQK